MRILRLATLLVALVLLPSAARAGEGVVLESYTGPRPASAAQLLQPMLAELSSKQFSGGDTVGRKFENQVSRAAGTPQGLPTDFAERVEKGHRAYFSGRFEDAVQILGPLVDAAHANTGAFATTPALRDRLLKANVALALSQHRLGDQAAARDAFGELVRSFPDAQVARGTYGPEANTLYEQMKKELGGAPRGHLVVKLANEDAQVFINEHLERTGTTAKDLLPGEYRVIVQLDGRQSRDHKVTIKPGTDATITVDLGFDAVVRSGGWVGFEFPTAEDRERSEAAYAQAFANSIAAGGVIVVGFDEVRGRAAVVGSLISTVNGRELRRASLALEPEPSEARLRALAKFLGGEQASQDIEVEIGDSTGTVVVIGGSGVAPQASSRRWGGWKWITGIGAAGALAGGTALLLLDGTCPDGSDDPNCPDLYNTAAPGWGLVGGGAVLAGITVYLILSPGGSKAPTRSAFVVPTDGGAFAGVAATF